MNDIKKDGAQFNYGYKTGYFSKLVSRLEAISKTDFTDLKNNINKAKDLADYALGELESGNYTSTYRYVPELHIRIKR